MARIPAIPRAANPMLAGSGATDGATAAVPIRVPAARGAPNTALICAANTEFKLNTVVPPDDERSNRATLAAVFPPALTVPNRVLFVRLILKLVSAALAALRVRFNPPE